MYELCTVCLDPVWIGTEIFSSWFSIFRLTRDDYKRVIKCQYVLKQ